MSNKHHAKALNGRPTAEATEFNMGIQAAAGLKKANADYLLCAADFIMDRECGALSEEKAERERGRASGTQQLTEQNQQMAPIKLLLDS
jgi:hypothetical protein